MDIGRKERDMLTEVFWKAYAHRDQARFVDRTIKMIIGKFQVCVNATMDERDTAENTVTYHTRVIPSCEFDQTGYAMPIMNYTDRIVRPLIGNRATTYRLHKLVDRVLATLDEINENKLVDGIIAGPVVHA